uniref:Rho-GAP domain-containing protein n=1 Tax=Glossina morsitans morsitans TaxID=37546 RepID=A0A1B0GEC5_GLOMM
MDFESPDVEKDFPGLYASEGADGKAKTISDSEGDHDKLSKKDLLIGRRKDKKEKSKDRGYAALEGESSPEEELDAKQVAKKSPSKAKKSKAFKFTSSKSKEKREKSRDKEKCEKDGKDEDKSKEKSDKEKHTEKDREKDKDHKKKERKEKDKKEKSKDKDKDKERKEKKEKTKQSSITSEEALELGSPVFAVFGVSVSLATERSRCHDGVDIPLVIRDCIDYLQEHALKSEQIYRIEPMKTRLLHYKRLYNNRERQPEIDELDLPMACGLMKLFLRELPEPILTTDLIAQFEEVGSYPQVSRQQEELEQLLELLPSCNKTLLSWILLHFDAVIQHEKWNKMNAQSLAMLLSPPLQMSHRLLVGLLCHCSTMFADVKLIKYVPPLTASSPMLPDTPKEIQIELRKQESLLNQIHSEMNAGFVSKKREEQLWEVQRIITQLKRKLRSFEKKQEKSAEELEISTNSLGNGTTKFLMTAIQIGSDDESNKTISTANVSSSETNDIVNVVQQLDADEDSIREPIDPLISCNSPLNNNSINDPVEDFYVDEDSGFLLVSKTHPDYTKLIRLQLENQEFLTWKGQLQARISAERAEILRLKQMLQQATAKNLKLKLDNNSNEELAIEDYECIVEQYIKENTVLEHKKQMLSKEIFEEKKQCIALQVEIAMQQF